MTSAQSDMRSFRRGSRSTASSIIETVIGSAGLAALLSTASRKVRRFESASGAMLVRPSRRGPGCEYSERNPRSTPSPAPHGQNDDAGDSEFESSSLQRRVLCEPVPPAIAWHARRGEPLSNVARAGVTRRPVACPSVICRQDRCERGWGRGVIRAQARALRCNSSTPSTTPPVAYAGVIISEPCPTLSVPLVLAAVILFTRGGLQCV